MNVDGRIVRDYIEGKPMASYRGHWLYSALGNGVSFTPPEETKNQDRPTPESIFWGLTPVKRRQIEGVNKRRTGYFRFF